TFDMLALAEHGMLDAPTVHWTHMLPGSGIRFILRRAYHGDYRQDWFTPLGWRADRARLKDQFGTFYMLCCMRACGIRAAFPRKRGPLKAIVVASHMRRVLDAEGSCLLYANVSQAVRAAVAAEECGFDLAGAAVFLSSEPLTHAKAERIERAGIRIIAGYGSVETGAMGLGCARRSRVDEVHLAMDAYALIDQPY